MSQKKKELKKNKNYLNYKLIKKLRYKLGSLNI